MSRPLAALTLAALLAPSIAMADDGPAWEELFVDEGITVWRRDIPGTSLVEFRGRGIVNAPMLKVAAVIRDDDRKPQWMKNCVGAATIEYGKGPAAVVYNRTGSPAFFISDRDIVLNATTKMHPKDKLLRVDFWKTEHDKMPPIEGVVRMPQLKGHWGLRQVDANTTDLTYQVQADPGGSIPTWLVNWVNKKLPFHTIANMRTQVKADGYDKHERILAVTLDWSGFSLPDEKVAQESAKTE